MSAEASLRYTWPVDGPLAPRTLPGPALDASASGDPLASVCDQVEAMNKQPLTQNIGRKTSVCKFSTHDAEVSQHVSLGAITAAGPPDPDPPSRSLA